MNTLIVRRLQAIAGRLGCTPAEALALALLAAGACCLLAFVWWQQRTVPTPGPTGVVEGLTDHRQGSDRLVASASPGAVAVDAIDQPLPSDGASPTSAMRVHVAGEVMEPGVYELVGTARVVDAVEAAGGPTGAADLAAVNLAQPLSDGMQVRVPAPGDAVAPVDPIRGSSAGGVDGGKLDLNTADGPALEELPGVGPVMARRILEHREAIGGFRSVDELLDVRGIGESTLAELAGSVVVGP